MALSDLTTLESTALLGAWPADLVPSKKLSPLGILRMSFQDTIKLMDTYNREVEKAADAGELTGHGLTRLRRRLATEGQAEIEKLRRGGVANVRRRIDSLEADLRKATDPALRMGDVRSEIRAVEIRRVLRGLDPLEIEVKLRNAASAGDRETLAAALNAPRALGIVPDELRGALEQALWGHVDAGAVQELEDLRVGLPLVERALDNLEAYFTREAGNPTDPVFIE
ncbi:MAG: hypothetical protein GXP48_00925 [Acidobacteria bacterium]|nr:hypothetical protein [Acidobacteriota bacterium]